MTIMTRKRARGTSPNDQPLKLSKLDFPDSLIEAIVDDNKGTSENPLNLDDDDDVIEYTGSSNTITTTTTTTTTSTTTNTSTTNDPPIDSADVETIMNSIKDNNIYLKPNLIGFGNNNPIRSTKPVVFNELDLEFEISLKALQPYQSKGDDVLVAIKYKDITKFAVSFRNAQQTDIELMVKEFTFKKGWLKRGNILRSYEAGIPHEIYFRSINKDEFTLMRPAIGEKSQYLNVIINIEDNKNTNKTIIAKYPHRASTSTNDYTRDVVSITCDDLSRLESYQYLNDSIVDFYIRYCKDKYVDNQDKDRFYFFNTYFYNILTTQNKVTDAYPKISKWTRDVDIFSKDFLFIPICENFHWTLIIVTFPYLDFEKKSTTSRPTMLYLDSLKSGLGKISHKIREYLSLEWNNKKSKPSNGEIPEKVFTYKTLPLLRCNVPKQNNLCDCGVFLLHYLELFCRNPEKNFDEPLNRPNWFPISEIEEKRKTIKSIINILALEQSDNGEATDNDSDSNSDCEREGSDDESENDEKQEKKEKKEEVKEDEKQDKVNDTSKEHDKSLEIIEPPTNNNSNNENTSTQTKVMESSRITTITTIITDSENDTSLEMNDSIVTVESSSSNIEVNSLITKENENILEVKETETNNDNSNDKENMNMEKLESSQSKDSNNNSKQEIVEKDLTKKDIENDNDKGSQEEISIEKKDLNITTITSPPHNFETKVDNIARASSDCFEIQNYNNSPNLTDNNNNNNNNDDNNNKEEQKETKEIPFTQKNESEIIAIANTPSSDSSDITKDINYSIFDYTNGIIPTIPTKTTSGINEHMEI